MVDYAIDSTFDIFRTEYDNISEVDGLEEFEQDLIVELDTQIQEYTGGYKNTNTLEQKVVLLATRLARQHDILDSVVNISANPVPNRPETLAVEIEYESSQTFDETL